MFVQEMIEQGSENGSGTEFINGPLPNLIERQKGSKSPWETFVSEAEVISVNVQFTEGDFRPRNIEIHARFNL